MLSALAIATVRLAVMPLSDAADADRLSDLAASSMVRVAPEKDSECAPIGRVTGSAGAPTATVRVEPDSVPVTGPSGRLMFRPARKLLTADDSANEVDGTPASVVVPGSAGCAGSVALAGPGAGAAATVSGAAGWGAAVFVVGAALVAATGAGVGGAGGVAVGGAATGVAGAGEVVGAGATACTAAPAAVGSIGGAVPSVGGGMAVTSAPCGMAAFSACAAAASDGDSAKARDAGKTAADWNASRTRVNRMTQRMPAARIHRADRASVVVDMGVPSSREMGSSEGSFFAGAGTMV